MIEGESKNYQFNHNKRIHLGDYHGIARDIMEINDPIADGFMKTSDMRGDIVIVQKPQERATDYDQVGHVRIAKFLQMPRLDLWRGDRITETRKEGGGNIWYVAINDRELMDQVSRLGNGEKKLDERFLDAFKAETAKALKTCLKREKLLNSGNYNLAFLASYYGVIFDDLVLIPTLAVARIAGGDSPTETLTLSAASIAISNTAHNVMNLSFVGLSYIGERLLGPRHFKGRAPNFEDPFVRHSVPELVMPPVPLDKLFRGIMYLNKHGDKIITPIIS